MPADEHLVLRTVVDGVATLTMNRPAVLNALDHALSREMHAALTAVGNDPQVRVVVIRGAGDAFMAGGDIGFFRTELARDQDRGKLRPVIAGLIDAAQKLVLAIRGMPKPVIASVHGACAGFGLSLVLASDLAIAADSTKFTLAYIHLATTPDGGASYHLPRIVGQKRAAEIALLGDRFGAAEAERWGIVNRFVPLAELPEATAKLALRMARGPALAYARTKALLNASDRNDLPAQLAAETEAFADSALTEDFAAGVGAFLDKRPATFFGR